MSFPLIIRPEALADLVAARDWYNNEREDLGTRFIHAAEAALKHVSEMPEIYAVVHRGVRRCRLRRFPYLVYYRIVQERVEVLGVIHGSRHPRTWKSRL